MKAVDFIQTLCMVFSIMLFIGNRASGQGNWQDNPANPQTWTTGNVGIGTSLPAYRLDVRGGIARFGNGTTNYGQFDAAGNLIFGGSARYFVSPNTHAFKAAGSNIGFYFNAANNRLEFQDAAGTRMFSTDIAGLAPGSGYFSNDLTVNNNLIVTGNYIVEANTYAFKALSSNIGMYFNQTSQRIEHTNSVGTRMFSVNIGGTDAGDAYLESDFVVGGTVNAAFFAGDGSQLTNLASATDIWDENGSDIYYNGGQVGIGTASPSALLEVYHSNSPDDVLRLWAANVLQVRLDPTGHVGIGTGFDELDQKLTVKDANHQIAIVDNDNNDKRWTLTSVQNLSGFGIYEDGSDGRLVIDAGGEVGIGTTAPIYQLQVLGNGNSMGTDRTSVNSSELNTVLQRSDNSVAQAVGLGFSHSTNSANIGAAIIHERSGGESMGKLHFATKNSSTTAADIPIAMTIDSDGEVGIGTVNPSDDLHLEDGAFARIKMVATDPATNVEMFIDARGDGTDRGQIGTLSNHDVNFLSNNSTRLTIKSDGRVGVGPNNMFIPTGALLAVQGKILCEEVEVELSGSWSDFVFDEDYVLMPLDEVEKHIRKEGHLPDIPSAKEVLENGINLGEMQARLLQKVEELTLHLIDLKKEVDNLKNENIELKRRTLSEGTQK